MSHHTTDSNKEVTAETSAIWGNHITVPGTPAGFTVRTTFPTNPTSLQQTLSFHPKSEKKLLSPETHL